MSTGTGTASWRYCAKCGRSHPNTTAGCDYTAPVEPNAKPVSYADVLREAAEIFSVRAEIANGTVISSSWRRKTAALRALAALVTEAEKIGVVNGIMWGDARALVIALQAGYTPPEGQK